MKNLFLTLFITFASSMAFANNLECKNNHPLFNQIFNERAKNYENRDIEGYLNYMKKYDYAVLFIRNHPNQIFNGHRWQNIDEFKSDVALMNSQDSMPSTAEKFLPITANFILSKQEICVIPRLYFNVGEEDYMNAFFQSDIIWIRNLDSNEWRFLEISSDESREYLNEFIPGFPKYVHLSPY